MENSKTSTAVIYARVSSEGDRQNTERQVADLNRYALGAGLEVVNTFTEKISGATKNKDRSVLCACLDYCEANNVSVLLLSELSRLGRDTWEVLENVKGCMDSGLNIFFQKECFSLFNADGTPSPFAPVVISCLGMSAQLEREAIAFRLNSGRAKYIANGGKLGRKVGSVKTEADVVAQYPNVVKQLKRSEAIKASGSKKGIAIRDIAKVCEVSPTTVVKVKKALGL